MLHKLQVLSLIPVAMAAAAFSFSNGNQLRLLSSLCQPEQEAAPTKWLA
jgi:hypothetical protein